LCFNFFKKSSKIYNTSRAIIAVQILIEKFDNLFFKRIINNANKILRKYDDCYLKQSVIFLGKVNIFVFLEKDNEIIIRSYYSECEDTILIELFSSFINISQLYDIVNARVSKFNAEQISGIFRRHEFPVCKKRAIELFCTFVNFINANHIYHKLIDQIVDILTELEIDEILSSPWDRDVDLIGSYANNYFLDRLISRGIYTRESLIEKLNKLNIFELYSRYSLFILQPELELPPAKVIFKKIT
jgi:hypothetical protein